MGAVLIYINIFVINDVVYGMKLFNGRNGAYDRLAESLSILMLLDRLLKIVVDMYLFNILI